MTATDELRRLLDERGVEYEKADGWWTSWETEGASSIGGVVYCEDLGSGLEIRWHIITPEQAIAATLGAGTCRVVKSEPDGQMWVYRHEFSCACGQRNLFTSCSTPPNYCPNCGRRCVD